MPTSKQQEKVIQAFANLLQSRSGIPFDEFITFALYDPEFGYYTKERERVGRDEKKDFFTSSSLGSIWGELIVDACQKILGKKKVSEYSFVEIAAEPGHSILNKVSHPFADTKIIRYGNPQDIPEQAIVYSNEWLDAQPFKRFRFDPQEKIWQEIGVTIENGRLKETEIDSSAPTENRKMLLPSNSARPYQVDWPSGSIDELNHLCSKKWSGLFLTFDYGLPKITLLKERPQGTARTYKRHRMGTDLLSDIGDQDITCHLCWDDLAQTLEKWGFNSPKLASQESFLMNNAGTKIEEILTRSSKGPTSRIQVLKEIIHPLHMGNKFQALWGVRE